MGRGRKERRKEVENRLKDRRKKRVEDGGGK